MSDLELIKPDLGGLEQYVGYQESDITDENKDNNLAKVLFLKVNNNDGQISISIELNKTVECKFTQEEIKFHIEDLFNEFPRYKIPPFDGKTKTANDLKCNSKKSYEMKVKDKIAMQTRRGAGNTKFGDTIFYKGVNEFDCPLIVVKKGDLYGIFKHPDFDKYGFNLIEG